MEINYQKLASAISMRKSWRKYMNRPLEPKTHEELTRFQLNWTAPFAHNVKISIHQTPEERPILVMAKAPPYFAAMRSLRTILDMARMGFAGEVFILYAVSLGLSTCWFGHYREDNVFLILNEHDIFDPEKDICCITPLGYTTEKASGLSDFITHRIFSAPKKGVEQNLHDNSLKDFSREIHDALELASLAPSAMNCQCWYFKVASILNGRTMVEISKPVGYKHLKWAYTDIDVGAAAAHFWVGLKAKGVDSEVSLSEEEGRAVWRFVV